MRLFRSYALLCLLPGLLACSRHPGQEVQLEARTTAQGAQYAVFYPQQLAVEVATTRPSQADDRNQLSVAAAYTDLDTYQPLDLLVANGRLVQPKAKVGFLDGVLTIVGDSLSIGRIAPGQSPPPARLAQVSQRRGTLLLQELLVFEGKSLKPVGGSLFQRRALAEFADHRFAVVESEADDLSMQQFGDDLVALGACNAIYLDMGDWDEGWYKEGGRGLVLGHRRTETRRQSNWLVFKKPQAAR